MEHYRDNRLEANSELGKMVKSQIVDDSLDDQQESSIQVDESRSEQTLSEFSNERKPVVISLKRSDNKDTGVRGGTSLVTCNICGPHRVMKKYHLREAVRVEKKMNGNFHASEEGGRGVKTSVISYSS